jgi:tagaturonate reductase
VSTVRAEGRPPRLGAQLVRSGELAAGLIAAPTPELLQLPEKAVQFGTGAFLRGFVDFFLDEANRRGAFGGRVVAIGSTSSGRDVALNEQDGLYTLLVEGIENGAVIQERRIVGSVSRALSAQRDWDSVLAVARTPELEFVFSNTTEIGIAIDAGDQLDAAPPTSYPGKLTRFLLERARAFDFRDDAGVVVLPCELLEENGERLRQLVVKLARQWRVEEDFLAWLKRAVPFCNTLVDRIVPGRPDESQRDVLAESLPYRDELTIVAEPYRLFAIEAGAAARARLGFARVDPGVVLTNDVTPYRERKVRILNGGHTLIAALGLLAGCGTVREALEHELLRPYLEHLLFMEIVPSLTVPDGEGFARDVLDRFDNPFLRHALVDITLQQTAKMRVRVVPSIVGATERAGSAPPSLSFGFAAYLLFVRESLRGLPAGADAEGERLRALWRSVPDDSPETLRRLAAEICADSELWQADLAGLPGFRDLVVENLMRLVHRGVRPALEMHVASLSLPMRDVVSSTANDR